MLQHKRYVFTVAAFLTLNAALWFATAAFSLPRTMVNYFLGPKMIRAEIVLKDGVLHDIRLDQGRIRAIDRTNTTLTLKERDGQVVTIALAPGVKVKVNGVPSTFTALRVGWQALTIRDNAEKAGQVFATKPK